MKLFLADFLKNFVLKTYCTLFLLTTQNNFYVITSPHVEWYVKNKSKSKFHVFGWFSGLQNLHVYFGKSTAEQVLKSFLGRNNSLKPPFFGFCDNLTIILEESRELRALIRWVLS